MPLDQPPSCQGVELLEASCKAYPAVPGSSVSLETTTSSGRGVALRNYHELCYLQSSSVPWAAVPTYLCTYIFRAHSVIQSRLLQL